MVKPSCRTLATIGLMLWAIPSSAHQVHVSAQVRGSTIHGEAYFHGGVPVRDATVTAFDPSGQQIGTTRTDQQGEFSLKARFRCDHKLLVDAGEGHGAEFLIVAGQLPKRLPPRGNGRTSAKTSPDNEQLEAIRAEIGLLREQLSNYEQKIRLRDILGGIGYIVGIAGVTFYFLGVRRLRSKTGV